MDFERPFFLAAAAVLGACVGSFLNVVIHRLPLGMSVNEPRRSFCPACRAPIRPWHNVPVLGWLWLRGRCADCRAPISPRYPLVELLTAGLFLAAAWRAWPADPWLALPGAVFAAILVAATFIDLDHLIIPDELTWGGAAAGLVLSAVFPALQGETAWWRGLAWAAGGAALGWGLLRIVVEGGKLAFGRSRVAFDPPEPFVWKRGETGAENATLRVGGDGAEAEPWIELFPRDSDRLQFECERVTLGPHTWENATLTGHPTCVEVGEKAYPLAVVEEFSGVVRAASLPREAMGLGDVKLLAAIGAFCGWAGVLFTVGTASLLGSLAGLALLPRRRRGEGAEIPFGPFLALGALWWWFAGPETVGWYLRWTRGEP